jgi:hypothetical protein
MVIISRLLTPRMCNFQYKREKKNAVYTNAQRENKKLPEAGEH